MFDQMIVNGYKPGEGIISHVDLMKFDDGIVILSLGAPATMTFSKDERSFPESTNAALDEQLPLHHDQQDVQEGTNKRQPPAFESPASARNEQSDIALRPGDLLLMHGEARYAWKHGIAHQSTEQSMPGRVSVTFRKLAQF